MWRAKQSLDKFDWANVSKFVAVAVLFAGFSTCSTAQQPGQKTFSSAQDAMNALIAAAKSNDQKAMIEILGPSAKQIVSSGDQAEDAVDRANFLQKYNQMHRMAKEPDGTTTLYVGAENWPMPIPLMNKGRSWYFDAESGKREILYRRVGENELSAIRVCQEFVAAENEYYSSHHNEYAQKIFSDDGQQNGLYWKVAPGQPESPIGPLVASAVAEGYKSQATPTAYRGYYFHIVTAQGKSATGGAKSYIANGKMTGGFALVAYPAEYRSSGVMTFAVDKDGIVYQKDLGRQTAVLANAMKQYDPDSTWQKGEDQQEESAGEAQNK